MAIRSRQILKDFFSDGKRPSQEEFRDLIDSAVNILDDGYSKDAKDGLKLAPKNDSNTLLSMCTKSGAPPSWIFTINDAEDLLIERNTQGHTHDGSEGDREPSILLNAPKTTVIGDIEIRGIKKGTSVTPEFAPVADGKWHDITGDLYGMYAMEIMASVCGKKGSGEYAVLMAWATNCYGSHNRIRRLQSHFGFFGHKLKLRWKKGKNQACRLQIKTRLRYKAGQAQPIDCHITYLHKYERTASEKA